MNGAATVSVVVSTHDRRRSLERLLAGLAAQTWPRPRMEVVVVANGCRDDTAEFLRGYRAPFELQAVEQPDGGPAGGRNRGAKEAHGDLLVFLDDDVEPSPDLVRAHAEARAPDTVVIGYLPPAYGRDRDLLRVGLRTWWERLFATLARPGHRFRYTDFVSGNFSIPATLFERVGGFTLGLRSRDDYELAARLLPLGTRFVFSRAALGRHHDATDLDALCRRKYWEGHADVAIGTRHPSLRATLELAGAAPPTRLSVRRAAPASGPPTIRARDRRLLALLGRLRLHEPFRRRAQAMFASAYWCGVGDALGGIERLPSYLRAGPSPAHDADEIEVDLREGLPAAERRLDDERPDGVRIRFGDTVVGRIPPEPGAERLRGLHLRAALAHELAPALASALMLERALLPGAVPVPAETLLSATAA